MVILISNRQSRISERLNEDVVEEVFNTWIAGLRTCCELVDPVSFPPSLYVVSKVLPHQLVLPCGVGAKCHTSSIRYLCLAAARRTNGLVCRLVERSLFSLSSGAFLNFAITPLAEPSVSRPLKFIIV